MHMTHKEHRLETFEEYYGVTPATVTARVRKFVGSKGLQGADAENVTQETLLTMVIKMGKPDREPIENGMAFSIFLAKKRLSDHFRRQDRLPEPHEDDDRVFNAGQNDDMSAIDDDTAALATKVVSELDLSPRRRQVADMLWNPWDLDFNAVPQAFVAKELRIAPGTVKSTVSAIKTQFRAALAVRLRR